jgi:hypothetical protein
MYTSAGDAMVRRLHFFSPWRRFPDEKSLHPYLVFG